VLKVNQKLNECISSGISNKYYSISSFSHSFRDNPEVDIVGANLYNALLQKPKSSNDSFTRCGLLAHPRLLSAKSCESILVCTGVYDPNVHKINTKQLWAIPTTTQPDASEAITYVLNKENII
jgi:hypothetical protein